MGAVMIDDDKAERPLRAIIEIIDGKLVAVYPVADSDIDREIILCALRKLHEPDNKR